MAETTATRLNRIEEKLDKMSDALVSLARAEEKIGSLMNDHDKMHERLNRFSEKLDNIEKKVDDNARVIGVISRLFWVALIAVSGAVATTFWM